MNNGIFLLLVSALSIPLTDTGATGISKYTAAYFCKRIDKSIPFNGKMYLFGTGCNDELTFGLQLLFNSLGSD